MLRRRRGSGEVLWGLVYCEESEYRCGEGIFEGFLMKVLRVVVCGSAGMGKWVAS